MSSNIKVFKLVSGDEIIGKMVESSDDTVFRIHQPMIFRTSTMLDTKGNPYDITTLKDWMLRADIKIADIPKTQISIVFDPNEKTIQLYTIETSRTDYPQEEILNNDQMIGDLLDDNYKNSFNNMMNSFMDHVADMIDEPPQPKNNSKKKRKKKQFPPQADDLSLQSFIPDELKKRPMIYLSMVIPPEAIMNLMSAGIIDPDQLLAMIEEIKKENKFTGDEKKRKDFGNKFSDWNPDPESPDYE